MLFWIYVIEYLNSSKRRFSNPAFQNSCSNPYFWGFKTWVSKFRFKTDIENLKLEKLNSYFNSPKDKRQQTEEALQITCFKRSICLTNQYFGKSICGEIGQLSRQNIQGSAIQRFVCLGISPFPFMVRNKSHLAPTF